MIKFNMKENIKITCKRPFHRVAVAYCCSRNTAKKYIGWAVAFGKYQQLGLTYNGWICFEDYRDFRMWKRQQNEPKTPDCNL